MDIKGRSKRGTAVQNGCSSFIHVAPINTLTATNGEERASVSFGIDGGGERTLHTLGQP